MSSFSARWRSLSLSCSSALWLRWCSRKSSRFVDDLIDEVVEQLRPGVGALLSVLEALEPLERLAPERVQAQMQLQEDVFLALEVVVERGLRACEPLGDFAQRGLVVALLVEQLERDVEDALARRPTAGVRRVRGSLPAAR